MRGTVFSHRTRALAALAGTALALTVGAVTAGPRFGDGIRVAHTAVQADSVNDGLSATYYNNIDFTGSSVSRTDPVIDFNWGHGSPAPGIDPTTYSVRWTGTLTPPQTGVYRISTTSDDGVRVQVGNELIVNSWTLHPRMSNSGSIALTGGKSYPIKVEYFQQSRAACCR
jgi:hypothetical protein